MLMRLLYKTGSKLLNSIRGDVMKCNAILLLNCTDACPSRFFSHSLTWLLVCCPSDCKSVPMENNLFHFTHASVENKFFPFRRYVLSISCHFQRDELTTTRWLTPQFHSCRTYDMVLFYSHQAPHNHNQNTNWQQAMKNNTYMYREKEDQKEEKSPIQSDRKRSSSEEWFIHSVQTRI